jgi:hypothetical protein
MHRQRGVDCDADRPAQAIESQPSDEGVRLGRFDVEEQVVAIGPDEEIEQRLALWRQQRRPDRQGAGDVIGDEALKEPAHILSGQADDGAIGERGGVHTCAPRLSPPFSKVATRRRRR